MIDYDTFLHMRHLHQTEKLTQTQIAAKLGLHPDTVAKWVHLSHYPKRRTSRRASKLDPFKGQIKRWLEAHPFSSAQILQRLQHMGYDGGRTILKDYLREIRPRKQPAYLKLHFDPGECAQVDWGECGPLSIGTTRRKLQVFVMVLCYSRLLFMRFYLSQSLECFLDAHRRAFEFFGAVPRRLMIDNLKTGVIEHRPGQLPEYHPRYLDLARHYGCSPIACNVGKGNEKGRVERGVGYIKDNFLAGRPRTDLNSLQAAAEAWRDQVANARVHGSTHAVPRERFEQEEKPAMQPLRIEGYDCSVIKRARLSKDARVVFETNTYSVPPGQSNKQLTLKVEAERLRIYDNPGGSPVAEHVRSYARYKDTEDPAHTAALKDQRRQAREQNLMHDFRALGAEAVTYADQLVKKHLDYREQIRRLLTLASVYGAEKLCLAMEEGLQCDAIHAAYVENLLTSRERGAPEASPLHLPRHEDALNLPAPQPDLDIYTQPRLPKNA